MNDAARADDRWQRLRRVADRISPFSPFVTRGTFSPAARKLLAQVETGAERVLHASRLLVLVVAVLLTLFGFGLVEAVPYGWGAFLTGLTTLVVFWTLVWWRLARGAPMALRVGLICFDAFALDRGILFLQDPGGLISGANPELYAAAARVILPRDVEAVTLPMLVLFAFTGAVRLDPRLALLTTGLSLAILAHLRVVVPASALQTAVVALVVAFAGLLGSNAARVFRFVAWKATQEEILARYVTPALTDELVRTGDPDRAGRLETISVLIADIRGFTTIAERLRPDAAVRLLNECFEALVAPVTAAGGMIDKYVGDGFIAFFEGGGHAERALRAARAMLAALDAFNGARADGDRIRIGIAVHAGETLVGTVGAAGRREYTVIGDVVNTTSRLEECNKRLDSSLVVSEAAFVHVDDPAILDGLAPATTITLRGRASGIRIRHLPR